MSAGIHLVPGEYLLFCGPEMDVNGDRGSDLLQGILNKTLSLKPFMLKNLPTRPPVSEACHTAAIESPLRMISGIDNKACQA